ncbi:hypothetical protein CBOM_06551 [Ceraceosorus bombacis]|uniref:Extradiol ring-cleavage dioxygenase class III enzyme subunit B domain-containing protein n=1 Tax=Ceraceosorus bombacis TaxID=401625 RepID=A0A0P1BLQ7_9BASI|nr:hypothetical protein CBOM_06551 [Ceraceosorus bombacis]
MAVTSGVQRAPVLFMSHGGPPTLFDSSHPAHKSWVKTGSDLSKLQPRPRAILAISAHWESEARSSGDKPTIQVNSDAANSLIYDFYNFPAHYYEQKFPSSNPSWLSDLVLKHLNTTSFAGEGVSRGPDHGVWVPMLAAFPKGLTGSNDIPLVQVSLPRPTGNSLKDAQQALQLGEALRPLREQGILIFAGGQAVHNLGGFRLVRSGQPYEKPTYAAGFLQALSDAIVPASGTDNAAKERAVQLTQRREYKLCHPTDEHFLPHLVALGATYDGEKGTESLRLDEGFLGWTMYRWSWP